MDRKIHTGMELEHLVAKCVVLEKKNTMPGKVDKPTQNTALQGISEQENFMIKVLFICHGNICRSTMAQYVMQYLVDKRGLSDCFYIDSAATSREEIGNGVHHGTRAKLREVGIPCGDHRARQMTRGDYEEYDYLIGMDTWNIRNMNRIVGADPDHKIHKLLEYTNRGGDIADPWYTGNFDETYRDVSEGCEGLLAHILKEDMD